MNENELENFLNSESRKKKAIEDLLKTVEESLDYLNTPEISSFGFGGLVKEQSKKKRREELRCCMWFFKDILDAFDMILCEFDLDAYFEYKKIVEKSFRGEKY